MGKRTTYHWMGNLPSGITGLLKEVGPGVSVSFYVRSRDNCPTEPTYDWKYLDQYRNFRDADKGFRIFCKD